MRTGVKRIADERKRQINKEGWTAEHDQHFQDGELALAAALYATPVQLFEVCQFESTENRHCSMEANDPWPWDEEWDKRLKHSRLRQLEIAGALIAAEIDRVLAGEQKALVGV